MATFVLTDASITINSVDLSDHGNQVQVTYEAETQDDTAFGDDTRSNAGGLKVWSMEITFLQDFAASEVDATLWSLVGSTTTVAVKPTSDATSATNPSFNGTGLVTSYTPLGNSVGEQAAATVSITSAGTLSRSTA